VRRVAAERCEAVWLAGGVVRDRLLGRPLRDLDLVLAGDVPAFAKSVAAATGATIRAHDRFGTAALVLPDGPALDLAAARTERYAHPGALPTVALGATIEEDLARRDFTVNAMAIPLSARPGLVDPYGGAADLGRRWIRILHAASFRDDPTRILRAVRYAARLAFRLEPATRRALGDALRQGALETISADRRRRELRLLLEEPARAEGVRRMHRLGLDAAFHPALAAARNPALRLRRAEHEAAERRIEVGWLCYLLAWIGPDADLDAGGLVDRLGLTGEDRKRMIAWPETRSRFARPTAAGARAAFRRAARRLSKDELVAAAAGLPARQGRALLDVAADAGSVRLSVRGADLVAAGIPPGPAIGRALSRTLAAREEGVLDRAGELDFALREVRREGA
jgi:tRNA nucleotidyltransferase (CCA-adding enzyme)